MQLWSLWEQAPTPGGCAVGNCSREARLFCQQHPDEGLFCMMHRRNHTRSVTKRSAVLDSRPRDEALTLRPIERFESQLAAINRGLIREGSPLV
jgi:hypothetical protein